MDEAIQQQRPEPLGNEEASNVLRLFDPAIRLRPAAPRASAEELAEFRRYWPLMKQMLREWERVKASGGCPVAAEILAKPPPRP